MVLSEEQCLEALKFIQDADYTNILRSKDVNNISYLRYVFELHFKLFGETCSNCPSKITGYIQKLKNYKLAESAKNLKIMEIENQEFNQEFKLKDFVIIPVPGTSDSYSANNITDEIAVKLLSENPARKDLFEVLPTDWEAQVEDYIANIDVKEDAEGDEDLELPNIDDIEPKVILELFTAVNVTTKATTLDGFNKKIAKLDAATLELFNAKLNEYLTATKAE